MLVSGTERRGTATSVAGSLWLEQIERAALDGERDEAGLRPAGVGLSGIPPNAPPGADWHTLAIRSGRPALARNDQEKLSVRSGVGSDDPARRQGQAGQPYLAGARSDPRGAQSLAAVALDDSLSSVELEDLHGVPFSCDCHHRLRQSGLTGDTELTSE